MAPVSDKTNNGLIGILPVLLAAALFAFFAAQIPAIAAGEVLRWSMPWFPSQGIELAFLLDGLSLTFALLISGIGTLVLLYSDSYLAGHPQYARFALFLTSFLLAMLGLVLADDLILLFVFWELTTLTSYLLIGFSHEAEKSRRNALQALFVTGAGGLAFLAGLILMGFAAGSTSISEIIAADELRDHAAYTGILVLVFAGALTKSAQVPVHFWLPNAMAAPTPVSAFLHSATMVKAGIYLLARMHPALSGTPGWIWTLTILGAATAVFASLQSLRQTDLKQALAYTTLMALGTLTLLLGQDSGYAMTAFATFLIVHSLYKAALFLVVGNIDAATGTREVAQLGGLGRSMTLTAGAAALAALSMAGAPPFLGFIGKELKYAGALAADAPVLVAGALVLANALMFAVAGVVALRPFWLGSAADLPRAPKERSWRMLAGPVVLGVAGTLFGIFPGPLQQALVTPTVAALTGDAANAAELTLWHGVNLPLLLSLATFALGLALYAGHRPLRAGLAHTLGMLPDLDRGWDRFLDGLKGFAEWQAARIQSGRLSFYLAATFGTVAGALLVTMLVRGLPLPAFTLDGFSWAPAAVAALMLAGGVLVLLTRSRITAIAGLGTSGIAISLVFLIYGAPDVAITQLLVETLVVVLVAVALLKLPRLPAPRFRPGAAVISVAVGASISLILLSVLGQPLDLSLTSYFEAASYPDAHGRNIVNVILVDFRAIDTFGEIAVVAIAALSALALLRGTKGRTR
ncbi:MAG TPA: Na(+)/H(+) antiporter subunit A [Citreicella sp.]|jgi:multicomponent Na+:H+ antiporter subunit A|nr:Na(+)/H(+) antiporter subunit A [Citreicella sp.]HBT02065.1 Na(+)/H(+) antiporter subunit A [Citreicella sp.]